MSALNSAVSPLFGVPTRAKRRTPTFYRAHPIRRTRIAIASRRRSATVVSSDPHGDGIAAKAPSCRTSIVAPSRSRIRCRFQLAGREMGMPRRRLECTCNAAAKPSRRVAGARRHCFSRFSLGGHHIPSRSWRACDSLAPDVAQVLRLVKASQKESTLSFNMIQFKKGREERRTLPFCRRRTGAAGAPSSPSRWRMLQVRPAQRLRSSYVPLESIGVRQSEASRAAGAALCRESLHGTYRSLNQPARRPQYHHPRRPRAQSKKNVDVATRGTACRVAPGYRARKIVTGIP